MILILLLFTAHSLLFLMNMVTLDACLIQQAYLSEVCESATAWYKCKKVKAVIALNWNFSFSEMIFSILLRSETVHLHWLMRIMSWVGGILHSSSTTLAAMLKQQTPMQDKCLGCTYTGEREKQTTEIYYNWHVINCAHYLISYVFNDFIASENVLYWYIHFEWIYIFVHIPITTI